ncbi:MAG: YcxB family protein [Bacteroidales bacterium]
MKKIYGWILIISCSFLLLSFTTSFFVIIPGIFSKNPSFYLSRNEIISLIAGFLIVFTLLILGLINGIKYIKKEKPITTIDYPEQLDIRMNGKIVYTDYRNLILGLSFKKPVYLLIIGIFLLIMITNIFNQNSSESYSGVRLFVLIFIGVVLITPILTLIRIKKVYDTHTVFKEHLNYHLSNESIHIKGESVDAIQKWNHFYKIKETTNFFMLYSGNMVATLLDKKMFKANEIDEFRRFIKSLNVIIDKN